MVVVGSSETSVLTRVIWSNIPEDSILHMGYDYVCGMQQALRYA
jgi:hypothetical protein